MARKPKKNPHAVALGRAGGKARTKALTPEERSAISRLGGLARAASGTLAEAGLVGGPARARALTPEQRAEIARKAAAARWGKKDE